MSDGSTAHVAPTLLQTRGLAIQLEYGWVRYYPLEDALRRLRDLHLIAVDRPDDLVGDDYGGLDAQAAQREFARALALILGQFGGTGRQGQVDFFNDLLDFIEGAGGLDGLESLGFSGLAAAAGINARDIFDRGVGLFGKFGMPGQLGGGAGAAPVFGPDGFHLGLGSYDDLADAIAGLTGLDGYPADLTGLLPGGKGKLPAIGRPGQEVGSKDDYIYGGAFIGVVVGAIAGKGNGVVIAIGGAAGGFGGALIWNWTHDAPDHSARDGYTKDGAEAAVLRAEAAKDELDAAHKHNDADAYLNESKRLDAEADKKQKEAEKADKEGKTKEAEEKKAEADQLHKDAEEKRKQADEAEKAAQQKEQEAAAKKKKADGKGSLPADDGSTGGGPRPEWSVLSPDGGLWVLSRTCPTGPGMASLIEDVGADMVSLAQLPSFSREGNQVRLERAGVLARNPAVASTLFLPADDGGPGTPESLPADDGGPVHPNTLPDGDGSEPTPTSLPLLVETTMTVGVHAATAGLSQSRLRGVQDAIATDNLEGMAQNIASSAPGLGVADALAGLDLLHAHVELTTDRA